MQLCNVVGGREQKNLRALKAKHGNSIFYRWLSTFNQILSRVHGIITEHSVIILSSHSTFPPNLFEEWKTLLNHRQQIKLIFALMQWNLYWFASVFHFISFVSVGINLLFNQLYRVWGKRGKLSLDYVTLKLVHELLREPTNSSTFTCFIKIHFADNSVSIQHFINLRNAKKRKKSQQHRAKSIEASICYQCQFEASNFVIFQLSLTAEICRVEFKLNWVSIFGVS